MKNRRSLKTIAKGLRTAVLVVLVLLGVPYIYLRFIVRDIPRVDDSSMKLTEEKVPLEQNAFSVMAQAQIPYNTIYEEPVRIKLDLYRRLLDSKNGKLSDAQMDAALALFSEKLKMVDRIGDMPYSQAPLFLRIEDQAPNELSLMALGELRLEQARRDLEHGRIDEAFRGALSVYKYGDQMEYKNGGSTNIGVMLGTDVKHKALSFFNDAISRGFSPGDVTKTINELESRRETDKIRANAFKREYQCDSIQIDRFSSGVGVLQMSELFAASLGEGRKTDNRILDYLIMPLFKKERARRAILEFYKEMANNASAEIYSQVKPMNIEKYLPACRIGSKEFFKTVSNGEYGAAMFSCALFHNYLLSFVNKFSMNFFIEATELRVALLDYKRVNGRLPDKLSALVPKYFKEVPRDPFDGNELRYAPENEVIYSVGKNITDDGGNDKPFDIKDNWINITKNNKDLVLKIE